MHIFAFCVKLMSFLLWSIWFLCQRMEIEILFLCHLFVDFLGSSQKKNAAMLDSDDADSVSSSSTVHTDSMLMSRVEEVQVDTETFLDQCLDALYEKR